MKLSIYGSLIQAYKVCPRKSWFMTRNLIGNKQYESFAIWRFISENSCKTKKTRIDTINYTLEITKSQDENIISVKTNESLEIIESLVFQILYYIYTLKNHNITGEIKIPKDNKVIKVVLTEDKKSKLESLIDEMNDVLSKERPVRGNLIQFCKFCLYGDICKECFYNDRSNE